MSRMNPYEAPVIVDAEAKRTKPPRRLALTLLRIGGILTVGGIAGAAGVAAVVQIVYHGYQAPIAIHLTGIVSVAMFPIGLLLLTAGLFFLALEIFRRPDSA